MGAGFREFTGNFKKEKFGELIRRIGVKKRIFFFEFFCALSMQCLLMFSRCPLVAVKLFCRIDISLMVTLSQTVPQDVLGFVEGTVGSCLWS